MKLKVLIFVLLLFPSNAFSLEVLGENIPETIKYEGQVLELNGVGLRKATIFKVKVYVASLYVKEKSQDANLLAVDQGVKVLNLDFVRSVSRKKIVSAWNDGFEKQGVLSAEESENLNKLNSSMSDIEDGESLKFVFDVDNVLVFKNDKKISSLKGNSFVKKLLLIWIGDSPPNEDLKTGLLGLE